MKQVFLLSKSALVIMLSGLIIFSSCKKNSISNSTNTNANLTLQASESDAISDAQFDDVFNIAMGVQSSDVGEDIGIGTASGILYRTTNAEKTKSADSVMRCFTVTVEPATLHVFPKTVTIDFGAGCLGKDGKVRKGKIITTYTGPMFMPGSLATTTFDSYNVDSFQIEGTHTVKNTSTSNAISWTVKVTGGKITNTLNERWRQWNAERTHEQVHGSDTPYDFSDDIFQITGSSSGSNSNGISWTSTITVPLLRKVSCHWIGAGKIQIERNGFQGILDFGDGTCDNKVTITINGISYNILLH